MKRLLLLLLLHLTLIPVIEAQSDDTQTLHQNAKEFMKSGDYANATIILVRALEKSPNNLAIAKDLALSFYMESENIKAVNVLKPFVEKDQADAQAYQITGMAMRRMGQIKDADKLYKKALKMFPDSGPLYNDYGEFLWSNRDFSAIAQWEKGIEKEPRFPGNYFNAARYYFLSQDKIWGLIYGEIFINMESYSSRTAEIKTQLLDGYKKLFSDPDLLANTKNKNKFELAFLTSMNKQNSIVLRGLNPETLTMIRTRFILNWYREYADRFPLILFDIQKELLEKGLFQVYNQWIFGAAQNLNAFQNWTTRHPEEYASFNRYLQTRILQIPENQYYH
ncbi:MAG: hypothetical protein H3C36_12550 [Chitinophagaceae bacterium]|nr:hypothetical protein [Chitinophagaceae bacterium]MCW5913391.1 hypothetical protein [Chitinophagaceae bacterium]MCZ2395855.1 hypothetical protein [Chitinophagales bacterium]